MGSEKTHTLQDGRYVQIVSAERLREILDADGEDYSRPSHMTDEDQWSVASDDAEDDCDHPRMGEPTGPDAGKCLDCGSVCTCDDGEPGEVDANECPIHGA